MAPQKLQVIQLNCVDFAGKDPFAALEALEGRLNCRPLTSLVLVSTPTACVAAYSSLPLVVLKDDDATFAHLVGSGGAVRARGAQGNDGAIAHAQHRAAADLVARILAAGSAQQGQSLVLLSPAKPSARQAPIAKIVFG